MGICEDFLWLYYLNLDKNKYKSYTLNITVCIVSFYFAIGTLFLLYTHMQPNTTKEIMRTNQQLNKQIHTQVKIS